MYARTFSPINSGFAMLYDLSSYDVSFPKKYMNTEYAVKNSRDGKVFSSCANQNKSRYIEWITNTATFPRLRAKFAIVRCEVAKLLGLDLMNYLLKQQISSTDKNAILYL